jgi:hypothetical protein
MKVENSMSEEKFKRVTEFPFSVKPGKIPSEKDECVVFEVTDTIYAGVVFGLANCILGEDDETLSYDFTLFLDPNGMVAGEEKKDVFRDKVSQFLLAIFEDVIEKSQQEEPKDAV